MAKRKHRVRVVLTAETEVEIEVEVEEGEDPTDLTPQEQQQAISAVVAEPDWQVDWLRSEEVEP